MSFSPTYRALQDRDKIALAPVACHFLRRKSWPLANSALPASQSRNRVRVAAQKFLASNPATFFPLCVASVRRAEIQTCVHDSHARFPAATKALALPAPESLRRNRARQCADPERKPRPDAKAIVRV